MSESKSRNRRPQRAATSTASDDASSWLEEVQTLSFQEARTAMDLAIAQLQASDLAVEEMAGLYQRAQAYAERCQAVLDGVEQQVIAWEADPTAEPTRDGEAHATSQETLQ